MNIFFFGGSFDPPHKGHFEIVSKCAKLSDKLIIFPNKISLEKKVNVESKHRINMLKFMVNQNNIEIDDFEIRSNKKNYTLYTVEYLFKKYINHNITMVIGFDQLENIHNWYKSMDYINRINILCFNRNGKKSKNISINIKNINYINDFSCNISSSLIRKKLAKNEGCDLDNLLPRKIIEYIKQNGLYVA